MSGLQSPHAQQPVLSVREVSKIFGTLVAVDAVSFDVSAGEMFGLAGPNGAGKSTLFNCLTGIPFGPDSGRVELEGTSLSRRSPSSIARSGLTRTFQTEAVFDELSVYDNVRLCASRVGLGADNRGAAARARAALDLVGLTNPSDPAATLSLLGRKRLMIATAMAGGPRVLLLDEPAAGLEPGDQDQLVELLRQLNAAGTTIVIVEHVLRVLRALCQRMAVLDAGQIIAMGCPQDVLSDPVVIEAYLGPGGRA